MAAVNGAHCPLKANNAGYVSPLNFGPGLPDHPPKCTWHVGADPATSPHTTVDWHRTAKITPDATRAVGNTPLIRLNKIPTSAGLKCEVLVKCEFFNPGGSVKDRIGVRMLEEAERAGILKPGYTVIEPTSGNTGIGLALACAVKGYRCVIVMSEKMSNEKETVLRALGAEIVRFPITEDSHSLNGPFGVCHKLKEQIPNSIILDQYSNPGNPLAHYDTTAEEILDQCDGRVDMIVVGTGTGGTITGIGKKLKEKSPNTVIVGVDPVGSILAVPDDLNKSDVDFYEVEGIGYDFIPTGIDRHVVDRWVKIQDKAALTMAKRLIKEEGLLCGGSSGANVAAALRAAKNLTEGQRVVIILPDSIRNYLTKFVSDAWMEQRGFQECENTNNHWWWDLPVTELKLPTLPFVTANMTCKNVFNLMKTQGIDQIPVIDDKGSIKSMVTMQNLLNVLTNGRATGNDLIEKAGVYVYPNVTNKSKLGLISRILQCEPYVLIIENETIDGITIDKPFGIVTAVDLLQKISSK